MMLRTPQRRRSGVILLAVLIVIALLMLIGYKYFNLMNAELEGAVAANKIIQARRLADSGLHYAQFVLAYPETAGLTTEASSRFAAPFLAYDNADLFHQRPVVDAAGNIVGYFSLVSPRTADDPYVTQFGYRFGVEDESSKINLNWLLRLNRQDSSGERARDLIARLPYMSTELAMSITNWLQSGSDAGDAMYYAAMGYGPKYGPLESLEELLYIRGITPRLLLGNDRNRNGVLDPDEDDAGGLIDPGLAQYFTVYSRELNVDSTGQPRLNINDSNLQTAYDQLTAYLGPDLAGFIMAYRRWGPRQARSPRTPPGGSTTIEIIEGGPDSADLDLGGADSSSMVAVSSLWSLVDAQVQAPPTSASGSGGGGGGGGGGGSGGQQVTKIYRSPLQSSKPEVLQQYLPILFDKFTTDERYELPARININTAPADVVQVLPGITTADVQKILAARPAPGAIDPSQAASFNSPAWLMIQAQVSAASMRQWEPYITTRSQVYRVQAVGYFEVGGPMVRLEAVIDVNAGRPRLLYWRDISELGRGYPFSQPKPILLQDK